MNDFEERVQFINALVIAAECRGEIETKTIHVHVIHPVAQAVHHELERARVKKIERVARAGEIQIHARFFRREAIVGLVIDPTKT